MLRNRGFVGGLLAFAASFALAGSAVAAHDQCATCAQAQERVAAYRACHPKPCGPVRRLAWWVRKPKATHLHLGVGSLRLDSHTGVRFAE